MKNIIISVIVLGLIVILLESLIAENPVYNFEVKVLNLPGGIYRYVDQEILIQSADGVSINELKELLASYGAYIKNIDCLNKYGFSVVVIPKHLDLFQVKNDLKISRLIKSASLNYVGEVHTNDPYFNDQWALRKIVAENGWNKFTKGDSSVVIAILDSGNSTHEDKDENRVILGINCTDDTTASDTTMADIYNHGMPMAGVISACTDNYMGIAGIAWYPELLIVKVIREYDGKPSVTCEDAAEGISSVIDSANANPDKHYIINCSFGFIFPQGEDFSTLADAVVDADA